MKQLFITIALIASTLGYSQIQKEYVLNTNTSVINWKGSYLFSFSSHSGTVQFKEGILLTTDGNITGGSFVIDMLTITNPDYENGVGPVEHLRHEDFFFVKKYPEARLAITSVAYITTKKHHRIIANLTIKGVTKPITFFAIADPKTKTVRTQFKIDRTRWGITYNAEVKDHAISDAIEFDVLLSFKK